MDFFLGRIARVGDDIGRIIGWSNAGGSFRWIVVFNASDLGEYFPVDQVAIL